MNEVELKIFDIWKDVLKKSNFKNTDNFFALGGDSLKLGEVISDISIIFDLDFPMQEIFPYLTVESQADFIQAKLQPQNNELKFLVLLKKGTSNKEPLIFCHDPDGTAITYLQLANTINTDRDIYTLVFNFKESHWEFPLTWDQILDDYIQEIELINPNGPYFFAGLSMGGQMALEISNKLYQKNRDIKLCALFDTVFVRKDNYKYLDFKKGYNLFVKQSKGKDLGRLVKLFGSKLNTLYVNSPIRHVHKRNRIRSINEKISNNSRDFTPREVKTIIASYIPKMIRRSYDFSIQYYLALRENNYKSYTYIKEHVSSIELIEIDCYHGEFITDNASDVAYHIEKVLNA